MSAVAAGRPGRVLVVSRAVCAGGGAGGARGGTLSPSLPYGRHSGARVTHGSGASGFTGYNLRYIKKNNSLINLQHMLVLLYAIYILLRFHIQITSTWQRLLVRELQKLSNLLHVVMKFIKEANIVHMFSTH